MKILIVDDSAEKIKKLREYLNRKVGIADNNIEIAQSFFDARQRLKTTSYDLMILDVMLPIRPGDQPTEKGCTDLLAQIRVTGELNKPRFILGLTAFEDILEKIEPHFVECYWHLVYYDLTSDAWLDGVKNIVEYLADGQPNVADSKTDLCIITALQKEMKAVHALPWNWEAPRFLDDSTLITEGSFVSGGKKFKVTSAVAQRKGMVETAHLTTRLILQLRPKIIIMTGICAGLKSKNNFGDVILANPAWDYQSGKHQKTEDSTEFAVDPHQLDVPVVVTTKINALAQDDSFFAKLSSNWPDAPDTKLKLMTGPVASGSAVIADPDVVETIKKQHRDLAGIEMEIYGLYAAAFHASRPLPITFALKAVCDFADDKKSDKYQSYACYTSSNTMKEFIERYMHTLV